MTIMYGGYASQGTPIGILLADTVTPRIVGDVGNAFSFDFPVRYQVVDNSAGGSAPLADILAAARTLEALGCRAITAGSDAFAPYQAELNAAVRIPVFASPLIQAAFLGQILPPQKTIGVLTRNAAAFDPAACLGWGLAEDRILVCGMEDSPAFDAAFSGGADRYDYEAVAAEAVNAAEAFAAANPSLGALLCESVCFSPFAAAIARATGLPVYDVVTLTHLVASGILRGMTAPFHNHLDGGTTAVPPSWGRPKTESEASV